MTECHWARPNLTAARDELLTPAEAARLASHLAGCPTCTALGESFSRIEPVLAAARPTPPRLSEADSHALFQQALARSGVGGAGAAGQRPSATLGAIAWAGAGLLAVSCVPALTNLSPSPVRELTSSVPLLVGRRLGPSRRPPLISAGVVPGVAPAHRMATDRARVVVTASAEAPTGARSGAPRAARTRQWVRTARRPVGLVRRASSREETERVPRDTAVGAETAAPSRPSFLLLTVHQEATPETTTPTAAPAPKAPTVGYARTSATSWDAEGRATWMETTVTTDHNVTLKLVALPARSDAP